jgi:hypothetical protein
MMVVMLMPSKYTKKDFWTFGPDDGQCQDIRLTNLSSDCQRCCDSKFYIIGANVV